MDSPAYKLRGNRTKIVHRSSSTLSHANSSGRAVTYDNKGPVTVITDHNHIPEPEREEGLLL